MTTDAPSHPLPTPSRLSRRRLIGGAATLGAGVGGAVWLRRSDSGAQGDTSSGDQRTLRLLCWPGYDHGDVTEAFREQHDVRIEATYLGANDEIFTLLRAGGLGTYDIVTPHNGIIHALVAAGLLDPLSPDAIPNAESLFPRFQWPDWVTVDGQVYGAPFIWGTSPMIYAPSRLATPPTSWLDLQATKYRGRIVMTEDGFGHFLIWNAALGHDDPTRITLAELNATTDVLIGLKRDRAAAYVGPMSEVARLLARGTAWVSTIGWESTPYLPEAGNAGLKTTHPKTGDYSFCDNLCLAHNAPNPDLAQAFIDYMLAPEKQAQTMNLLLRGTVSEGAVELLNANARALYNYDDLAAVFARSPLRGFPPLEDEGNGIATYVDWVKAWERVRFTQMKQSRT